MVYCRARTQTQDLFMLIKVSLNYAQVCVYTYVAGIYTCLYVCTHMWKPEIEYWMSFSVVLHLVLDSISGAYQVY